jgi:voltage-gated potassium channel
MEGQNLKDNFNYMLVGLTIFLIGVPIGLDLQLFTPDIVRTIGFSAILIIGVLSLKNSGRSFAVGIALVIAGIVMNLIHIVWPETDLVIGEMMSLLAFMVLATGGVFHQIAASNVLSPNRIVGAICVYLLIGVIWSIAYALLELAAPGSFDGFASEMSSAWEPAWVYYSFVTLTSLGYGDLLPLTNSARTLSYLETVVGQFYLAIMVAGLVGAYLSAKSESDKDSPPPQ